jgi:hypothetical protein
MASIPYATSDPFGLGNPNLLQRAFTFGVQALRQPVEDVGGLVHPAARLTRRRPHLTERLPEAESAVGNGNLRSNRQAAVLEVEQHLATITRFRARLSVKPGREGSAPSHGHQKGRQQRQLPAARLGAPAPRAPWQCCGRLEARGSPRSMSSARWQPANRACRSKCGLRSPPHVIGPGGRGQGASRTVSIELWI